MSMSPDRVVFTVRLTNSTQRPQTVILEPWTGEYRLPPGVPLDIVVEGTPSTPLQVEIEEDRVIVTSFDTGDALLTAFREGRELRSEHNAPDA
jgi:hypothetical protein